jgi:hypothetical protein
MPRARATGPVDVDRLRPTPSEFVAPLLLAPTHDNLELLIHRAWGYAKARGYSREEKRVYGAIVSIATRLAEGARIDRMATSNGGELVREVLEEPMLKYFRFDHLAPALQEVSKPFCELAQRMVDKYPRNPERTVCLRKLLEAKDAAVRCALP